MGNAEDLAIALPHPCSVSLHQTVKSQWLHLVSKKKMDLEYTFEKAKLDPFSAGFVHSKPVLGVPRFGSGWDACFHRHGGGETMMHSCNIVLHFVSPSIAGEQRFRRSMKQINLKICRGMILSLLPPFMENPWQDVPRSTTSYRRASRARGKSLCWPRQRAVVDLQDRISVGGLVWKE